MWLFTLLLIRGVVALQAGAGLPDWILAAVPLAFIYVPVGLCAWRRVDSYSYHLAIPAFSDLPTWRSVSALVGRVLALVVPPFLLGYTVYQALLFDHHAGDGFRHGLARALAGIGEPPPALLVRGIEALFEGRGQAIVALAVLQVLTLVAYQVFFVAIPEEFFYRGYFQTRLNEVFPRRFLILGVPMGWGSVLAGLYFAFGHSLVQVQWWHFATFFPGLVFAWLREKSGGVVAGALCHAAFNVLVVLLDTAWGIPR